MQWCGSHRVPIVPRGAGTGLAGGAVAVDGGVVLSLENLDSIRVDTTTQTATVGPGVLNGDLKAAVREHGLWYPPDPSSFRISTIGGNIATNAGGLCCVQDGVTRDYVLGLEVVLADGEVITLGGELRKDVAGLALLQLFIGSEGILGIVTGATLRLTRPPAPTTTFAATFHDMESAAHAVIDVRRESRPSLLELMDDVAIGAVEDHRQSGLDRSARCLLLVQVEQATGALEHVESILISAGAKDVYATQDRDEGEQFIEARRLVLPAAECLGSLLLEDIAVPLSKLPHMCRTIDEIRERTQMMIPVVAHAGDGNLHPMIVHDRTDPDSCRRAQQAFDEILAAAIALGGTITGEHGVGRTKRAALPTQLGERVMQLTADVKRTFDPDGILNPGAVIDTDWSPHKRR
ncbi:FAD-linked oxidase C-terminal domain-containing protein [Aeromicrobium panaciterrae]